MQSKVMIQRVKNLEKKIIKKNAQFIFFTEPTEAQLAKLPPGANVIIFTGEDEIKD